MAAKKLVEFWEYLSFPSSRMQKIIDSYKEKYGKDVSKDVSEESLRRYVSGWYFLNNGLEKVFSPPQIIKDKRFRDENNIWYKYTSDRLEESVLKFANFPIATSFEDDEPRLLAIGVDVQEGKTVTFDSYSKPDGYRKTQSGFNGFTKRYPGGITIKEIMASAAAPAFYDYKEIQGRKIWDGILLSNTPIRETIEEYRAYWEWKIGKFNFIDSILSNKDKPATTTKRIPDLDIYAISLYPRKEDKIPQDIDAIKNRVQNILYCNKFDYDELQLKIQYDLYNVIQKLAGLAIEKGYQNNVETILNTTAQGRTYTYFPKENIICQDMLKLMFNITIKELERNDDEDSVYSKWADFTEETIKKLIEKGRRDMKEMLEKYDNQQKKHLP